MNSPAQRFLIAEVHEPHLPWQPPLVSWLYLSISNEDEAVTTKSKAFNTFWTFSSLLEESLKKESLWS